MINLFDLAMSSTVFDALTDYSATLSRLASATNGGIDLADKQHRIAVLKWLNDWGCRHLAKEEHGTASTSLCAWYANSSAGLFSADRSLWDLTDVEIAVAASAYGSLKSMPGAWRAINGRRSAWPIGPTAASEVLFALRPHSLPPWDRAMRAGFKCDENPESYLRFLKEVRLLARSLAAQCEMNGFAIADLPAEVGSPNATVVELINEYLWLKHARKWTPPARSGVARWATWSSE